MNTFSLLFLFEVCYCDWVSEWLTPVRYQYKEISAQNSTNTENQYKDEENTPLYEYIKQISENYNEPAIFKPVLINEDIPSLTLKIKLEEILKAAAVLTAALKREINIVEERERTLKEAIASGRSGITILIVSTIGRPPRTYFIRNGFWTLCNGIVQYPIVNQAYNIYTELFSAPRCIGQEVTSNRDSCVFNSLIKYETIPVSRRSFYTEDDYLCLKTSFNNTLETYMTVPRRVVNETCRSGIITSLTSNVLNCGLRVLSEYTYYPSKDETALSLPLEYCNEKDGSCKLMIGWHISNKTIENFEFFKNDKKFKNFFIKKKNIIEPYV